VGGRIETTNKKGKMNMDATQRDPFADYDYDEAMAAFNRTAITCPICGVRHGPNEVRCENCYNREYYGTDYASYSNDWDIE
jgi:hypothetical protein